MTELKTQAKQEGTEAVGEAVITTEGLGRKYRRKWAVRDLSIQVPRGAVYGLLGMNGAGKSTTIRMLMGQIRPDEGCSSVMGFDPLRNDIEVKRCVGYVPEVAALYEWMTVREMCGFVANYRRDTWDDPHAVELAKRFRLDADEKIKNLSKGQRAKVSLLLALAFHPDLLILDEPTTGLDPVARRDFIEGVLSMYQDEGKSILISSHLVSEIAGLVDHIGIIHEGQALYAGPTDAFLDRIRRARLVFADEAPKDIAISGALKRKVDGRTVELTVETTDEADLRAQLDNLSAESVTIEAMGLEDAFVEYVTGGERAF